MNKYFKLLLGTSLCLLERSDRTKKVRDRAAGKIDDFRESLQQKYEGVADRLGRASTAIRGNGNPALGNVLRLAAGIGVGVGVGLLLAPASGQETRRAIAETVRQCGNKVRNQVVAKRTQATASAG